VNQDDLKAFFFKASKWKFRRCLVPEMTCENEAIRAHSVQNARVLDLLCRDGHVTGLVKRIDKEKGPQLSFDEIGRNQATTFTGLCAAHDAEIFRPLDAVPFDSANLQHLFLAAYRSVMRELHAVMEAVPQLQGGYQKRVQMGLDPKDEPSLAGMIAVEYMTKAYVTYLYKSTFDDALAKGAFADLEHDVCWFRNQRPTLAVSSLFSLGTLPGADDWLRVILNVFPISDTETVAIFSYRAGDAPYARTRLERILVAEGDYQKYELSKLILNSCENFVLAPEYVCQWSAEKHKAVTRFFLQSLFQDDLEKESEHFYLF
jgi:hypothetical protein